MAHSIELVGKRRRDFFHIMCSCSDSASQLRKQLLFWIIQSSETNHSAIVNIRVFLRLILVSEHLDHFRQPFDLTISHIFSFIFLKAIN